MGDFEPSEDKINEIENNIFNKISESVDKIFNFNTIESAVSMNLSKINADYSNKNVNLNKNIKYEEAKTNKISNIDEVFNDDEIEEYRQTLWDMLNNIYSLNNPNNKSTTFFFEDSSKSNSEDEENLDYIIKPKIGISLFYELITIFKFY